MSRPRTLRAALLDMGGVLLEVGNSGGLPGSRFDFRGREALSRLVSTRGRRVQVEDLERLVFAPWAAEYGSRQAKGKEAAWDPHLKRLRKAAGIRTPGSKLLGTWFDPYGETLRPIEGTQDALAGLRRLGLRLALVSNVPLPGRHYLKILRRFDLAGYFEAFYFSYDEGSRKPSPAMLKTALSGLGVSPRRAIMVGDRLPVDVVAGVAAGTATAWIKGDRAPGPKPDLAVRSLSELPDKLMRLGWILRD